MQKAVREELKITRICVVLEYARFCRNVAKVCGEFEVTRCSLYK